MPRKRRGAGHGIDPHRFVAAIPDHLGVDRQHQLRPQYGDVSIVKHVGFCQKHAIPALAGFAKCTIEISGKMKMVGHSASGTHMNANNAAPQARAVWSTPRVIVSDLGHARAQTIIPGGDGSVSSYAYGS